MVKAVYIPPSEIGVVALSNCKEINIVDEDSLLDYFEQANRVSRLRIMNTEFFLAYNTASKEDPNHIASLIAEEEIKGKAILYVYNEELEIFEDCICLYFYQLFNKFAKRFTYNEQDYKNEIYKFNEIMDRGNYEDRIIKNAKKRKTVIDQLKKEL